MDLPTWVEVVSKLGTPVIAAVSAFYVFLQYQRAQRWKATDLAATLLEKLNTHQALALTCQALDWGCGPLIIPEQYRPLFPPDDSGERPSVMEHIPRVLCSAVEPMLNESTLRDPRGLVYRYCFIKLFAYLDSIFKLLADGQLREVDIDDLKYWLEKVRSYPYAPDKIERTSVFQPALKGWEFGNVVLLGLRLDVNSWIWTPPDKR